MIFAAAKAAPLATLKPSTPTIKEATRQAIAQPSIKFLFALSGFTGVETSGAPPMFQWTSALMRSKLGP